MSTNIVPVNIQVPAHLAGRVGVPSVLAQSLVGGIGGGMAYPRISIKGSRFRIIEGDTETVLDSTTIDVVIVGANPRLSKTYYAKQWSPDAEPTAPDCFSLDGIAPDPEATAPQNDLCASCPQNAWGSKVNPTTGQEIKACSDLKRIAVVAADDVEGPIYLMLVTPAALKGLNQYQKELSVRGIPPEIVKTRITFDTDASFPLLKFGFGGFLDADVQAVVDGLFGTPEVIEITGEKVAAPQPVAALNAPAPAPVTAPKAAPAKPAAAPKPVVVEPPAAAAPAPEAAPAKRGFGAAKGTTRAKATAAAAPAAAPAPAAKAAPVAPVAAQAAAVSLADEIAALVGEANADDA